MMASEGNLRVDPRVTSRETAGFNGSLFLIFFFADGSVDDVLACANCSGLKIHRPQLRSRRRRRSLVY